MANTYTQLYVHIITAVKYRTRLICPTWRRRLEAQIQATIEERGHQYLEGFAMPDHIHILIKMHTRECLSSLVGAWKGISSSFLQQEGICPKFQWQKGYGAFTVGHRELLNVRRYIRAQPHRHRTELFADEFRTLLDYHELDFDEAYVLDELI